MFIEPAANTTALEGVMQPAGEGGILAAVADEAGVELDRAVGQRGEIGDEIFGDARAAKEDLWDVALRTMDSIDTDGRAPPVVDGFKSLD